MLESMEGRRAMPRLRPPFPAQVGYLGRPTLINNVETLAHLPAILRNGGEWWAGLGTRGAAGTRLWSVTGAVGEAGLLRGAERHHHARARRGARGRLRGRDRRDRPRRRGERDPAPVGDRRAAHPRRPTRVRRRRRVGRRPGLPRPLLPAPPPRRDDALLRRGVVPEVHALPDREPRAPPPVRGARARPRADDAREGRRVAPGHGEDLDLRPRPGRADPGAERDALVAGALRAVEWDGGTVTAVVEFTLDGRTVSAPEGELIVHAAARHGTFIPTLCHDSKLAPYGGCRMCVVDVEGAPRPMPACATRVTEGRSSRRTARSPTSRGR